MSLFGLFGPPNVEKLKAKRDVKGLIKIIGNHKDTKVRRDAIEALEYIGDASAIGPLVAALTDDDDTIRSMAKISLEKIHPKWQKLEATKSILPLLIAALKHVNRDVRKIVIEALGKIGDVRAVTPLMAAIDGHDIAMQWAITIALADIGTPAIGALIKELDSYGYKQVAKAALVRIGIPAIEPLIATFKDNDMRGSSLSESPLIEIGAPAVKPLIALLKPTATGNFWGPVNAPKALKIIIPKLAHTSQATEVAIPALTEVLRSDYAEIEVRQLAIRALKEIGSEQAIKLLIETLKDKNSELRKEAGDALTQLGWQLEDDAQRALLAITCQDWQAVANLKTAAIEPLVAILEDSNQAVRRAAANTLGHLGDERAIKPLIALLGYKSDEEAATLVEIGTPAVESLIVALKSGRNSWAILAILEALGKNRDPRVFAPLLARLKEESGQTYDQRTLENTSASQILGLVNEMLTSTATELFEDDLIAVTQIEPITVHLVTGTTSDWILFPGDQERMEITNKITESVILDISSLKQTAQQELRRRGLK